MASLGSQALLTLLARAAASVPSLLEGTAPVPQGSAWLCWHPLTAEFPQNGEQSGRENSWFALASEGERERDEKGKGKGTGKRKGKGCAVGQGSAVPARSRSGILQQHKHQQEEEATAPLHVFKGKVQS